MSDQALCMCGQGRCPLTLIYNLQVRARTVGAFANHVLGGLHLHTTRALPAPCNSKFADLAMFCQGEVSRLPFGIDPAFRTTSGALYQNHLDDEDTKLELYNCSSLQGLYPSCTEFMSDPLSASMQGHSLHEAPTGMCVQGSQRTIFHTCIHILARRQPIRSHTVQNCITI